MRQTRPLPDVGKLPNVRPAVTAFAASILIAWTLGSAFSSASALTPILDSTGMLDSTGRLDGQSARFTSERIRQELGSDDLPGHVHPLRIEEQGTYTVEVESIYFDPYLQVRDAAGDLRGEDDSSGLRDRSRLVLHLAAGEYQVVACAVLPGIGPYRVSVTRGEPELPAAEELRELETRDALDAARSLEASSEAEAVRATGWNTLGTFWYSRGAFDKADECWTRCLTLRKSALGDEHELIGGILNNLGALAYQQGRYDMALERMQAASEIFAAHLGERSPRLLNTLKNLAALHHQLALYQEAISSLERVVAIEREVYGEDSPARASGLNNLAMALASIGRLARARVLLAEALAIVEVAHGAASPLTARALVNSAQNLIALGRTAEAVPLLERALSIYGDTLDASHPSVSAAQSALAGAYWYLDRIPEARVLFERSLATLEASFSPDHPRVAVARSNLSSVLQDLDQLEEAEELARRAYSGARDTLGDAHPATAAYLRQLGRVQFARGEVDLAVASFAGACETLTTVLGPDHIEVARTLDDLAQVMVRRGEPAAATKALEESLRIRRQQLPGDHPAIATSLRNLASALSHGGIDASARKHYEAALAMLEPHGAAVVSDRADILSDLACVLANLGDVGGAHATAVRASRYCMSHLDATIWSLTEVERLRYTGKMRRVLDLMLSLPQDDETRRRQTYESLLHWKGRVSRSLLGSRRLLRRQVDDATSALLDELRAVQSDLSNALYDPARRAAADDPRLTELQRHRNDLELALVRRLGTDVDSTIDIDRMLRALPAKSVALDFVVHDQYRAAGERSDGTLRPGGWDEPALKVWLLRRDRQPIMLDLGPSDRVARAVTAFRESLASSRGVAPAEDTGTEANAALRRILWEPIEAHLDGVDTLLVSADAFLGTLPFGVVQRADGSYLVEEYSWIYLQDFGSLPALADVAGAGRDEATPRLLSIGGVDFMRRAPSSSSRSDRTERDGAERDGAAGDGAAGDGAERGGFSSFWSRLPSTVNESQAVVDLHAVAFDDDEAHVLLQGKQASEERLKRELPGSNYIHLATHGFFQPEGLPSLWRKVRDERGTRMVLGASGSRLIGSLPGLLSGLALAGANRAPQPGGDDGLLTAEEISWLDLSRADLVVLSACETGIGSARAGEGMIGLRRAFRLAGARTVVSSLWSVQDEVTRDLMVAFYRNLWLRGQSRSQALRVAQLEILQKNRIETGHGLPMTWGAFVLDGAW